MNAVHAARSIHLVNQRLIFLGLRFGASQTLAIFSRVVRPVPAALATLSRDSPFPACCADLAECGCPARPLRSSAAARSRSSNAC